MSVLCVLPARLGSERIPRKPLQPIAGRPLVEWSWRAAAAIPAFDEVWVATDSEEIAACARSFGAHAVMTGEHRSGTERVAEAVALPAALRHDIVVNFQADEPFADPAAVARAVDAVREGASIATLAAPIRDVREWRSEGVVKVVVGADRRALYFSRAPVPHVRGGAPSFPRGDAPRFLRHVGVYALRREALERWVGAPPSRLEELERLEQLGALEAGLSIRVVVGPATEPGVDEPEDLARADRVLGSLREESESHV